MQTNSYTSAMGRLTVTPELRARVLDGALAPQARHKSPVFPVALAACLLLVVAMAGFPRLLPRTVGPNVTSGNPMHESESVAQLQADAPFPLRAPGTLPEGYTVDSTGVIAGIIAQIQYAGPQGEITYRMAEGTDDISGDYNRYSDTKEESVVAYAVTRRGDDGMVRLCTWAYDGYTYALSFDQAVTFETARSIIESIALV